MSLTFELGISSVDAITIMPEYSSTFGKKQIRSEVKTQSGRRYIYKWGDYDQVKLKVDFVSGENAAIVNSWWENNTELLFFVNSSSGEPDAVIDYSAVFSDYAFCGMSRGVTSLDYIKLTESVNSENHYVGEHFNGLEQNTDLYYDVKLKAAGKNRVAIYLNSGAYWPAVHIYLDNGSYYNVNSECVISTEVTSDVNDFWRVTLGVKFSDVTSVHCLVYLANSDGLYSYDGDGTSGVWAGDATLKGVVIDTEVSSVFIANKTKPLNKYAVPYVTYLKGSIQLEGY